MGSRSLRYTIRGLMAAVALAALALAFTRWMMRPEVFPVSGTITSSGRPLSSGKIILVPASPSGTQAAGPIVAGNFSLTTFAATDGALPGPYTVVIVSPGVPARYQSQATSGLTVMVQKGQNTINFDLQ